MSDLLSIGYTGLRAYSKALSMVGDNIANAQTPGYARRRLELGEVPAGSNMVLYSGSVTPGGVNIKGVVRSVDQWLIEDARISSGDSERAATRLEWMNRVEGALSDDTNGIKTALNKIYTTADLLTATPVASAYRVLDEMPFSVKRLRAYLRERGVGRLTVKKRGTAVTPEALRSQLDLRGTAESTVVLTRVAGSQRVLVVEPVTTGEQ